MWNVLDKFLQYETRSLFQECDVYWLLTPLQMATASLDMDLG